MRTCGHVPSRSPPSKTVRAGPEISVSRLDVKYIWIVFHDELYLVTYYAEWWVRSVKQECLSRIVLFDERALHHAFKRWFPSVPCSSTLLSLLAALQLLASPWRHADERYPHPLPPLPCCSLSACNTFSAVIGREVIRTPTAS
jgi:hypothetical protein